MKSKPKRGKAPWVKCFPAQAKAMRPENSRAGGLKARSQSEAVRMAVYLPIAEMFKEARPFCQFRLGDCSHVTRDIHHEKGRDGLLLFDIRYFKAACRPCHDWVRDRPKEAAELGLDKSHKGKI